MNAVFKRIGAFLIDACLVSASLALIGLVAYLLGAGAPSREQEGSLTAIGYFLYFGYRYVRETRGKDTLGRKLVGIHIDYVDNLRPTNVIKRNSWLLAVAVASVFWTDAEVLVGALVLVQLVFSADKRHSFETWAGARATG